jgi:hypothetical protein
MFAPWNGGAFGDARARIDDPFEFGKRFNRFEEEASPSLQGPFGRVL